MKKKIVYIILLLVIFVFTSYLISNNIFDKIYIFINYNIKSISDKEYKYDNYSNKVKLTKDFNASNKDELLSIYYTYLDSGFSDFSFYCGYSACLDDIKELSDDKELFTYINQLVHPYYSYKEIDSSYSDNGKVNVSIDKKYKKEDIDKINDKIDELFGRLNIDSYSNVKDKIRVFHDFLVEKNRYDNAKEIDISNYNSDRAIGPLFEGYATCNGYSDAMSIFLDKLNLDNIKIVEGNHAWNAVKIDGKWYHIDITWDDPVFKNNKEILHDYLLVTTDELLDKDKSMHNFNKELYDFIK